MLHAATIPRLLWAVLVRLATLVAVAGCGRLHFQEVADATPDTPADAPPLALACNTPVQVAAAAPAAQLGAFVTGSSIVARWIGAGGQLSIGRIRLFDAEHVQAQVTADPAATGYTAAASAAGADVVVSAYTQGGTSYVEVLDGALHTLAGPTATPIGVLGAHAVAMTGAATGPVAAVAGNDAMTSRAEVVPVNADGTLGTPVDAGPVRTAMSLVPIGDVLAIVNQATANNCNIQTLDLAVTAHGAASGWGTNGQCQQPMLGYSPGRADALLVRHDMTDGDLNHVIATRAGATFSTPVESRLRNPANEPRIAGVADGYWVTYETAGQLEAVHVDVTGTTGTPVALGPLSEITAHDVVVAGGEAYAIWLQDGLELAHLCP